jgi:OmpA-OmpF porin, OOP family
MIRYQRTLFAIRLFSLAVLAAWSLPASAQNVKVQGLIKGRSGATLIVQTADSPALLVLLTDSTHVGQIQGVLQSRRKEMSMAALVPGLAIQVEGAFDEQRQLVAKLIKFKGDDLKRAQSIQAGLHETRLQGERNREDIEKHEQELERQTAALATQREALQKQQQQVNAQHEKIAANRAAIDAAVARFGQLDDYYILDEVIVYFANGKITVDPQYKPQLVQLAAKAKTVTGYMIEVKGYASSAGSVELNQKLSEDRAHNVVNILLQQGRAPLTNMMAPGAMGESQSSGTDKTAEAQAENRKVVVRVLQNKGVAGVS